MSKVRITGLKIEMPYPIMQDLWVLEVSSSMNSIDGKEADIFLENPSILTF